MTRISRLSFKMEGNGVCGELLLGLLAQRVEKIPLGVKIPLAELVNRVAASSGGLTGPPDEAWEGFKARKTGLTRRRLGNNRPPKVIVEGCLGAMRRHPQGSLHSPGTGPGKCCGTFSGAVLRGPGGASGEIFHRVASPATRPGRAPD